MIFSRFPKPLLFSQKASKLPTKQVTTGSLCILLGSVRSHPMLHTTQEVVLSLLFSPSGMLFLSLPSSTVNVTPIHCLLPGSIYNIAKLLGNGFYGSLDNLTNQQPLGIRNGMLFLAKGV
jgi:hypothetical protein